MDQKKALHHEKGIPMLYFDQLSTIAGHLQHIKMLQSTNYNNDKKLDKSSKETKRYFLKMLNAMATHGTLRSAKAILPKNKRSSNKLTRRKLKNQPDWHDWQQSKFKQLDQYYDKKKLVIHVKT